MVTKYVEVEVDVDLDNFSDDDLIGECKDRQIWPTAITDQTSTTISDLFDAYTANKDITEHLRKLFDSHLGRII